MSEQLLQSRLSALVLWILVVLAGMICIYITMVQPISFVYEKV